jgi:hypothetical protein
MGAFGQVQGMVALILLGCFILPNCNGAGRLPATHVLS